VRVRQFILGFAAGLLAGGGAGYFATRKHLEHVYQEQANSEIDEMRTSFENKINQIKKLAKQPDISPSGVKKEAPKDQQGVPFVKTLTREFSPQTDYTRYSKSERSSTTADPAEAEHPMDDGEKGEATEVDEGKRYLESVANADRQGAFENAERDRKRPPRLIRYEEYGTDPRFEKTSLYYYTLDDVLATEDEEAIDRDDIYMLVGDSLTKYNFIDDPSATTIYVRNERLGCDYEITKVNSSYEDCVAQ
jgi:hypothetical protein